MTSEQFIERISQALGRQQVPHTITDGFDYSKGPQYSRLRDLDDAGVRAQLQSQNKVRDFTYFECTTDTLSEVLRGIIDKEDPNRVVVPKDTSADGIDLKALLDSVPLYCYDKEANPEAQRAIIESTALGITIPFRAVADTGTVLELPSDTCGKIVSLLPVAHISVIFQSRIRATLTDLASELDAMASQGAVPSYFLFVSGPSSTGDIESVMVTGVHGPTREYYVVVKDR